MAGALAVSTFGGVVFGIFALCIWIAIAFWPARVAGRKAHSFLGYFIFSLLLFPGRIDRRLTWFTTKDHPFEAMGAAITSATTHNP